ncbi:patatin-like phospholipase family protein [Salibacterium halotolerans]|uniref:NTE family protein n=1 Tax=Salibacterium halotolerans TaxID=1884432 RepID=A0A1I5NML5_9BACI|nr:patatin-like phospholipase family protein [Salibacterium halotolerans]SFP22880.1 NTE family protein [Salibacterium halotolerans]
MNIDGVFAGGGVKAFAFIGALQELEKKEFTFERTAGTSAGALMAALIQAGYTADELRSVFMPLQSSTIVEETFVNERFPWLSWISVYWKMGLYKGDKLEKWIYELLAAKRIYTFQDLPEGSLKIIASDLTEGRLLILPDDLPKYGVDPKRFPVALAVKMSCTLPYIFQPVKWRTKKRNVHIIVDGGILSNFPLWLFRDEETGQCRRPVIGFQLSPSMQDEKPSPKIKNALRLYQSLFSTMRKAHDLRYISRQQAKNIVFLPVENIKSTQFDLDVLQKKELIQIGKTETEQFLKQNFEPVD